MRLRLVILCAIALAGCDDKQARLEAMGKDALKDAASAPPSATASASAAPSATASAPRHAMPPRPVPAESPTVGAGMPEDVQMRAITYMAAMRSPAADDPNVDATYVAEMVKKLAPVSRSLDKGPARDTMNRVESAAGGRQIDLLMSGGCDAQLPTRAVVQSSGIQLHTLYQHGVLVVRCNDARFQCLQSTRDTNDVLCTTAPRKK
ncbi:MAG: hypothetical protein JNL38_19870 [Myxococcales bacterium]|nr:hypothetical protein [Myxococcales bacterium]